jgi:hypothetical protein
VSALPGALRDEALAAVSAFTAFSKVNDPHGERDFGAFETGGTGLFWKIDDHDLDLWMGSPGPAEDH